MITEDGARQVHEELAAALEAVAEHRRVSGRLERARATEAEKESQLARVRTFQAAHGAEAQQALARLKDAAISGGNVFAVLMDAARVCSLQQVTEAFFEVGGQYRRNV